MTKTAKQITALVSIVLVFALFNGCMVLLLTGRLSNNFSDTSQSKQIDVAKFLPHVPESDLARINFSLKLTDNLPVLDGANRAINPITRLAGSGSQSAMDSFMKGREIAPKSIFSVTGASIGFSFRYYMDGLVANDNVKMLALNGVYPSAENIWNGTYPIIAKFYAIYRADNTNPNIPVLIDWLLSDEGQTLIEESGYVRIN